MHVPDGFVSLPVNAAGEALWNWAPLPDYTFKEAAGPGVSKGLAGTAAVFGAGFAATKLLSRGAARPED